MIYPPVMGLFCTGYVLHLLWNAWQRRRAMKFVLRWTFVDPTPSDLDDMMSNPDHLAFLLEAFKQTAIGQPK